MLRPLKTALRVEDIRKRILYTFGLLLVFRVGSISLCQVLIQPRS